jgi:hypothetical protein
MTTTANTYPGAGILSETVMTIFDQVKPQHWNKLGARFGVQFNGIYQLLASMGAESAVEADTWYAHEENRYIRHLAAAQTLSTTAPGVHGAVTFTLAVTDHEMTGTVSFPRVGMQVLTQGEVPCQITAKSTAVASAHTITIHPLDALDDIGDLTGQTLIIHSGGWAAGTTQPDSTIVGTTKREFNAQIFKETVGQEGTQFVNSLWYEVMDDGRSLSGWYNPGIARAEYLIYRQIDGAITWGKHNTSLITSTTARGSANLIRTTKGIIPWISEEGKEMTYTSGSFDMADLDEITLYMKQQGIISPVSCIYTGPVLTQDIRTAAQAYIDGNGTDYTTDVAGMFGGKDKALGVNFTQIKLGDMTYLLKEVEAWNDPEAYSASGYDIPKYGIVVPVQKVRDAKSGIVMDNLAVRYRAKDGYSRRMEAWSLAGAGGPAFRPYTSETDEAMMYLRSHLGLQALKMNQAVILRNV